MIYFVTCHPGLQLYEMRSLKLRIPLLFLVASFKLCQAFGFVGHYIIGEVVHEKLSKDAREVIDSCGLLDSFNGSMGRAAVWADNAKYGKELRWTKTLHYFDTPNDPPSSCGQVTYVPGMNLLSALNNYTTCTSDTSDTSTSSASSCPSQLRFNLLLHLLQDLHQPLHLTGKARGGNTIPVYIDGKRYTLHGFWDSGAINAFITQRLPVGERNVKGAIAYFSQKSKSTNTGNSSTIVGPSATQSFPSLFLEWANEVSSENCKLLWRYKEMSSDEYVAQAMTLVEDLIVNAIQRSAYVLDTVLPCNYRQRGNTLIMQPGYP